MRLLLLALLATLSPARAGEIYGPYSAEVIAVLDGDTVQARVHLWPQHSVTTSIRINGINAPELSAADPCEWVEAWRLEQLVLGQRVVLDQVRPDKYGGRFDAVLWAGGYKVADQLVCDGFARRYDGGRRGAWCAAGRAQ